VISRRDFQFIHLATIIGHHFVITRLWPLHTISEKSCHSTHLLLSQCHETSSHMLRFRLTDPADYSEEDRIQLTFQMIQTNMKGAMGMYIFPHI